MSAAVTPCSWLMPMRNYLARTACGNSTHFSILTMPASPYRAVFSNGVVEMDDKVLIYYGAADETACVAVTDIDTLLASLQT